MNRKGVGKEEPWARLDFLFFKCYDCKCWKGRVKLRHILRKSTLPPVMALNGLVRRVASPQKSSGQLPVTSCHGVTAGAEVGTGESLRFPVSGPFWSLQTVLGARPVN